jgi:hypothetical protein
LERLAEIAQAMDVRFMPFKGHSVARTLYPHPACRPTSDFDVLIDAGQVSLGQAWLLEAGYVPYDPFSGTLWLGAQSWTREVDGKTRFHVDLHWDYTNRMYFRHRMGFGEIWESSQVVACGEAVLRVPDKVHNLIIACVHLAAFSEEVPIYLIWLLDIYLLMRDFNEGDVAVLLDRAQRARAVEACLVFGELAAGLGDADEVEGVLEALRGMASQRRMRGYDRTLKWRAWDLACYWRRLKGLDKVLFFGDMGRWVIRRGGAGVSSDEGGGDLGLENRGGGAAPTEGALEEVGDVVWTLGDGVRFRRLFDEGALIYPGSDEAILLNETGIRLVELIDGSRSMSVILTLMAEEFEVDAEELERDLGDFVGELYEAGIILQSA